MRLKTIIVLALVLILAGAWTWYSETRVRYDLSGKRVLILLARDFDQGEFKSTNNFLRKAGAMVVLAGLTADPIVSYHGAHKMTLEVDTTVSRMVADEFDAVVIPGGSAPYDLAMNEDVIALVRSSHAQGKIIAAICHGPLVLARAGVVDGKQVTSYPDVKEELIKAGGLYQTPGFAQDGNIITARAPSVLKRFNSAIAEAIIQR